MRVRTDQLKPGMTLRFGEKIVSVKPSTDKHDHKPMCIVQLERNGEIRTTKWGKHSTIFVKE